MLIHIRMWETVEQGYPCVLFAYMYGAEYTDAGKDGNICHTKLERINELDKLLLLRKDYAYGAQHDYLDHFNCIGWTREGIDEKPLSGCTVVMSNGC